MRFRGFGDSLAICQIAAGPPPCIGIEPPDCFRRNWLFRVSQ